jgi:hypothetical protein
VFSVTRESQAYAIMRGRFERTGTQLRHTLVVHVWPYFDLVSLRASAILLPLPVSLAESIEFVVPRLVIARH